MPVGAARVGIFGGGSAIPDSAIAHYDAQSLSASDGDSISTWPDKIGSFDLTGGSPVYDADGINGYSALDFDGVDDKLDVSLSLISPPNTVFIVLDGDGKIGDGDSYRAFDSKDTNDRQNIYWSKNGTWGVFAGSTLSGGTDDTAQLITGVFDGGNSVLRVNGATVASGDAGGSGLNGISVGASGFDNEWPGYIGEVVPCDNRLSTSDIEDEENRLANKWDITL